MAFMTGPPEIDIQTRARQAAGAARRRTPLGWSLRLAAVLVVVALLGVLAGQSFNWRQGKGRSRPEAVVSPAAEGVQFSRRQAAAVAGVAGEQAKLDRAQWFAAVVRIEAEGPAGSRIIGSGFVVDRSGLVATSLHVAQETTAATVRFQDGSLFDIAGYAALSPEKDLAVLQIKSSRSDFASAALNLEDPLPLSPVVAVGHPQGIAFAPADGRVSLVLPTSQLSVDSRRFLRLLTGAEAEARWVQHTARLSDGNSGGPLLNGDGEVVGINTWVDRQTGFSYALHIKELIPLLADTQRDVIPLEQHASAEARLRAALWNTTSDRLNQWHEQARAMRWRPESEADYAVLQQLAWALTLANNPDLFAARGALADRLENLTRQADRVVAGLREEKWNDIGQITLLNEYASGRLFQPSAGMMAFVTVERIVEGEAGKRAAIVQLAGFGQPILVPLDNALQQPAPGDQLLLVGVNQRGQTVRYGDNPLQPTVAPIVVAPVLIPLEE